MNNKLQFCLVLFIPILYAWDFSELQAQTITVMPAGVEVQYKLGNDCNKQGRFEETVEALKQAIRIKPDYAEAYNNLGRIYFNKEHYEDAVEALKQAIRIKPDYAEAYFNLGAAYGEYRYDRLPKSKTKEYSIEAYRQAIRIKPDFVEAYNNLGTALSWLGRDDAAIKAFKQAIRIKPDFWIAHWNLGLCIGDRKFALAEYEILRGIKPDMARQFLRYITNDLSYSTSRGSTILQFLRNYKYHLLTMALILSVVVFLAAKNRRRNKDTDCQK